MTTKKENADLAWLPKQQPLVAKRMRVFLYALMRLGNVSKACKAAKVNRTAIYQRKASDDAFAQAFEDAKRVGVSNLEDTAFRVANEGWLEPVFHDGEECGEKRRFSPALMIFLLKSHDPQRYRERVDFQTSGAGGGPMQLNVFMDPRAVAEAGA